MKLRIASSEKTDSRLSVNSLSRTNGSSAVV
jgi:hypothetical protein